ncbi:hypothetical protein RRSWK_01016 [Rhodopirellula sp. SWK7]|nr:hypothetical protein RRSWK_01016 [Rhodopirellula sp. SWK7]
MGSHEVELATHRAAKTPSQLQTLINQATRVRCHRPDLVFVVIESGLGIFESKWKSRAIF